jgi:hypothetical protein
MSTVLNLSNVSEAYGEVEMKLHTFVTSTLDKREWSANIL